MFISYFLLIALFPTYLVCFLAVTDPPQPSHSPLHSFPWGQPCQGVPHSRLFLGDILSGGPFLLGWGLSFYFSHLPLSCFLPCFVGVHLPVFSSGWRDGRAMVVLNMSLLKSQGSRLEWLLLSLVPVVSFHLHPEHCLHFSLLWELQVLCPVFSSQVSSFMVWVQERPVLTFAPPPWLWPLPLTFWAPLCLTSWHSFSPAFQRPVPSCCPMAVLPSANMLLYSY